MNSVEDSAISVPLDYEAHQWAKQFAIRQINPYRRKRVYLNTLAVQAVHYYLRWLAIDTDLQQSECWDVSFTLISDVADLLIPNIGRLECRPILPGETEIILPPEVIGDRIGYVAVQFSNDLTAVDLLGFAPASKAEQPERIQLSELRSLEDLIDYLIPAPARTVFKLHNLIEPVWQAIEQVLSIPPENQAFAFMADEATVSRRARMLNYEMQFRQRTVTLLIAQQPEADNLTNLQVWLLPGRGENTLPAGIRLTLLKESGQIIQEATAREDDYTILLPKFGYRSNKRFRLQVSLDDLIVTDDLYET